MNRSTIALTNINNETIQMKQLSEPKHKKSSLKRYLIWLILILLFFVLFLLWEYYRPINYKQAHLKLYSDIYNPKNGYFSKLGIPYHSIEKFIIEAVDYGHDATSEGAGSILMMNVFHAKLTGDWSQFYKTWSMIDQYFIPNSLQQQNAKYYLSQSPSKYVLSFNDLRQYPAPFSNKIISGQDPIEKDLTKKYGSQLFLMHWLVDADNFFGFGKGKRPFFIKNFERGSDESTWETITHPCIDTFGAGKKGSCDLYIQDPKPQWRYTSAPDAELRLIQSMYWAQLFSKQQHISLNTYRHNTEKMGSFLRYSLFDKYFQKIGAGSHPGNGYDSAHYLVGWMVGWGGASEKVASKLGLGAWATMRL